jgi:hypothetical protein
MPIYATTSIKNELPCWEGSIRSFTDKHDVDEKTIRQIIDFKNTIYKVCIYTLPNASFFQPCQVSVRDKYMSYISWSFYYGKNFF